MFSAEHYLDSTIPYRPPYDGTAGSERRRLPPLCWALLADAALSRAPRCPFVSCCGGCLKCRGALALGIELPEPATNDCAVPLCQDERSHSEPTPFLCVPHLTEFQHFKPETLYEEAGIVAYDYPDRQPWLRTLSYEDWRMDVFIHEKESDALLHDPYVDKYFPQE